MLVDSEAVFQERIAMVGLVGLIEVLDLNGWTTIASFASATSYTPGAGDDDQFIADVVIPLVRDPGDPRRSAVRRLFRESFTMTVAALLRRE